MTKEHLYSQHFQDHFLAHALRDKVFVKEVEPDLEPDYFSSEHAQRIVRILKDFHSKTGSAPGDLTHDVIDKAATKAGLSDDTVKAIKAYADNLLAIELQNRAYLLEQWTGFLRQRKLISTSMKVLDAAKADDMETAFKAFKEAASYQPKAQRERWDHGRYDPDPTMRASRRAESETEKLWTMIYPLDRCGISLGRGHVGIWVSQMTGVGKSTALRHCALASVFQGYKTLIFVVGEMSRAEYEDCLDQAVAGLCRDELDFSDRLLKRIRNMLNFGGDLHIVSVPSGVHSVEDLEAMANEIENTEGFEADTVIIDYMDNLVSKAGSDSMFKEGLDVGVSLERWAGIGKKRYIWTASQGKTGAADAPLAGIQHIGGSRGKGEKAMLVLTINRTAEEAAQNKTTINVAKSRFSASNFSFTIKSDFARQRFYVGAWHDEEV